MKSPKNVSLVIGLTIPVLMIAFVAASIYLPNAFAPVPRFNFLYVTGDNYYEGNQYVVVSGKLTKREVKHPEHHTPEVMRLFVYDVASNHSKEVLFDEAQQLRLDAAVIAPDGYEVAYGGLNDGVFPLLVSGGHDYNAMYLKGHCAGKKLNIQIQAERPYGYRQRARFLGWIR